MSVQRFIDMLMGFAMGFAVGAFGFWLFVQADVKKMNEIIHDMDRQMIQLEAARDANYQISIELINLVRESFGR